jgi:hypothetical protein
MVSERIINIVKVVAIVLLLSGITTGFGFLLKYLLFDSSKSCDSGKVLCKKTNNCLPEKCPDKPVSGKKYKQIRGTSGDCKCEPRCQGDECGEVCPQSEQEGAVTQIGDLPGWCNNGICGIRVTGKGNTRESWGCFPKNNIKCGTKANPSDDNVVCANGEKCVKSTKDKTYDYYCQMSLCAKPKVTVCTGDKCADGSDCIRGSTDQLYNSVGTSDISYPQSWKDRKYQALGVCSTQQESDGNCLDPKLVGETFKIKDGSLDKSTVSKTVCTNPETGYSMWWAQCSSGITNPGCCATGACKNGWECLPDVSYKQGDTCPNGAKPINYSSPINCCASGTSVPIGTDTAWCCPVKTVSDASGTKLCLNKTKYAVDPSWLKVTPKSCTTNKNCTDTVGWEAALKTALPGSSTTSKTSKGYSTLFCEDNVCKLAAGLRSELNGGDPTFITMNDTNTKLSKAVLPSTCTTSVQDPIPSSQEKTNLFMCNKIPGGKSWWGAYNTTTGKAAQDAGNYTSTIKFNLSGNGCTTVDDCYNKFPIKGQATSTGKTVPDLNGPTTTADSTTYNSKTHPITTTSGPSGVMCSAGLTCNDVKNIPLNVTDPTTGKKTLFTLPVWGGLGTDFPNNLSGNYGKISKILSTGQTCGQTLNPTKASDCDLGTVPPGWNKTAFVSPCHYPAGGHQCEALDPTVAPRLLASGKYCPNKGTQDGVSCQM